MLRWVMLRMVTLDGGEIARRRVFESELEHVDGKNNAHCKLVIQRFVDARLLVKAEEYVEPAHDALILNWEKLREWIEEEKENLILRDRLIPAVRDWQQGTAQIQSANWALWLWCSLGDLINFVSEQGMRLDRFQQLAIKAIVRSIRLQSENNKQQKSAEYLWHNNSRLEQLRGFLYSRKSWLNASEIKFVRQSVIRKGRNRIIWQTVSFVVSIAIVYFGGKALWEENQTKIGKVRILRESAEGNLGTNRQIEAAINILKAERTLSSIWWQLDPHLETQVKSTLYKILYATQERNRLQLDRGSIYKVAFNPQGDELAQLATVGNSESVRLWDASGNQLAPILTGHNVYSVAFNNQGTQLATGGTDGKVKFWEIKKLGEKNVEVQPFNIKDNFGQQKQFELTLPPTLGTNSNTGINIIRDLEFNGDSSLLLTVSNRQVKLWNRDDTGNYHEKNISNADISQEQVLDATLNPKQSQIATVGKRDEIKLWNTEGTLLDNLKTGQKNVYSIIFSTDGNRLATGGADGSVKWWKIIKKNQKIKINEDTKDKSINTHQGNIYSIAISLRNELAAIGDNNTVNIWKLDGTPTGNSIQPKEGTIFDVTIRSIALNPNGKHLATIGGVNTVVLWNTSGQRIRRFSGTPEQIDTLAFSLDGTILAASGTHNGNNILKLGDPASGKWFDDDIIISGKIKSLVFIPPQVIKDKKPLLVIKEHGSIDVLLLDQKNIGKFERKGKNLQYAQIEKIYEFFGIKNVKKITSIALSADARKVALVDKDSKKVILGRQGDKSVEVKNSETVNSVAFSPDGQHLATAKPTGVVELWNLSQTIKNREDIKRDFELITRQGRIAGIVFNSFDSNQLITGGADGTVRFWDLSSNAPTALPTVEKGDVSLTAATANGNRFAVIDKGGLLSLWDVENHTPKHSNFSNIKLSQFQLEPDSIQRMALSSTGKYLVISSQERVFLFDTEESAPRPIAAKQKQVQNVAFIPDSEQFVTFQADNTIKLWELQDGQLKSQEIKLKHNLDSSEPKLDKIISVFFSKNDALSNNTIRLATLEKNGTVRLWETSAAQMTEFRMTHKFLTEQKFITEQGQASGVIALSANGELVATGAPEADAKGTVRIWDKVGNQISQFQTKFSSIESLAFSRDKARLALIATRNPKNPSDEIESSNFTLLDIQTGEPLNQFITQPRKVTNAIFTPDGSVVTLSTNGRLSKWQMDDLSSLKERVCRLVQNYLKNHPNLEPADRKLCEGVHPDPRISVGEKVLFLDLNKFSGEKLDGIEAIAKGDFDKAIKELNAYLNKNQNDPEARIYLNNTLIGNQNSYTIAVAAPISSDGSGAAEILRGVAQAQKELNEAGGINGVPLRVLIADDQGDEKAAQQLAQQLADNPDVLGVVGHFASGVTKVAGAIYNKNKLMAISPVSTAIDLGSRKYVLRTVPNDQKAAEALATQIVKSNLKNAVVFYNSQSPYSESLGEQFKDALRAEDVQVKDWVDLSQSDFDAENAKQEVAQAKQNGADTLVLLADTTSSMRLWQSHKPMLTRSWEFP